jgi:hypothetical protein
MNDQRKETLAELLADEPYRGSKSEDSDKVLSDERGAPTGRVPARVQAGARYLSQQHWDLLAVAVNASGA